MKAKCIGLFAIFTISILWAGLSFSETSPDDILRRADEARGNLKGVQWTVHIVSTGGHRKQERRLKVKSKGYDFLATFIAPPKVKGQRLLMVNRNMWFMKPGLRKPVPISPRQRLIGGAAYGDIAAANYSNDYETMHLSEEMLRDELCYVFDLKAINKKATYDRIKYWVSKRRTVGIKADFYTISGKLFKSATFDYRNEIKIGNKNQPFISKISIRDALLQGNLTTMDFSAHKIIDIPPATFDLNLLMMR